MTPHYGTKEVSMKSHYYRYQIVRYIPDLRRMEPQNIGVIVQGEGGVTCHFNSHLGNKANFDAENYRLWRHFFQEEISGKAVSVFQPDRTSPEFLKYLQSKCQGNYSLTAPLDLYMDTDNLSEVKAHLYNTLVRKSEEVDAKERQPLRVFEEELERRKVANSQFLRHNRPFRISAGVEEIVEYQYTRNHGSDTPVLIQAVRWFNSVPATVGLITQTERLVDQINSAKLKAEVIVVFNEFKLPHSTSSDTRQWIQNRVNEAKKDMGSKVKDLVDDENGAVQLAVEVERDLKDLESSADPPILAI